MLTHARAIVSVPLMGMNNAEAYNAIPMINAATFTVLAVVVLLHTQLITLERHDVFRLLICKPTLATVLIEPPFLMKIIKLKLLQINI